MKKFLIMNLERTQILGSYEAEEKDESSSNRSYLLCPPHTIHIEESEANPNNISMDQGEFDQGILIYSHPKAVAHKMAKIRAERDIKMLQNDNEYFIAMKKDEDLTEIKAQAQVLRDIPQIAEEAMAEMSLEELNSYNPFEA